MTISQLFESINNDNKFSTVLYIVHNFTRKNLNCQMDRHIKRPAKNKSSRAVLVLF